MSSIDGRFRGAAAAVLGAALCLSAAAASAATWPGRAVEVPVREIPIQGPVALSSAEISGMAWTADTLVILPQDPLLFAENDRLGIFWLTRDEVLAALDTEGAAPLEPHRVECAAPGLARVIRGFDGLEAIGFLGDRFYITVEAKGDTAMAGYLLCGKHDGERGHVHIDMTKLTAIPLGLNLPNIAEESLVVAGERILTFSEANGRGCNPDPRAKIFDAQINYLGSLPFPHIEYRVTDATALDDQGRFWVMNYFFPPEAGKLQVNGDPEVDRFGLPAGQDPRRGVERLLELRLTQDDEIIRTNTPPIYLERAADGACRNWEALVRLDDRGFLVMTDKYPRTMLAFVPNPFRSTDPGGFDGE